MSRGWYAMLNGVALSGDHLDLDISGFGFGEGPFGFGPFGGGVLGLTADDLVGTLSSPPDGLGVPGLRVEDVSYPQRDGIAMFSDWYEPRVITLTATIGNDNCGCGSARDAARRLMKAWSRQCGQGELVIWPNCVPDNIEDRDPEIHGPYGFVGRPRQALLTWIAAPEPVAEVTLRFDCVDHRIYMLNQYGEPGSGVESILVEDTPVSQNLSELVSSESMIQNHYTGGTSNSLGRWFDSKSSTKTVEHDCTSLTNWTFASSNSPLSSPASASSNISFGDGVAPGNPISITATLTQTITYNSARPYVTVALGHVTPARFTGVQCRINGGSWVTPSLVTQSSTYYWISIPISADVTTLDLRWNAEGVDPGASTQGVTGRIYGVWSAPDPVGIAPGGVVYTGDQILPGLADSSQSSTTGFKLNQWPVSSYTSGMVGWWSTGRPVLFQWDALCYLDEDGLHWNGTTYPLNTRLQALFDTHEDPLFIMITWSSTTLRVWANEEEVGTYPNQVQEFTVSGSMPYNTEQNRFLLQSTGSVSDVVSGYNLSAYTDAATMQNLASDITDAGFLTGEPILITDVGTESSPITVTFTGGNIPCVQRDDGSYVGVNSDLGSSSVAILDTATGTLTIDGVSTSSLVMGDPFFTVSPGEELRGFGGGDIEVQYRPAVISA